MKTKLFLSLVILLNTQIFFSQDYLIKLVNSTTGMGDDMNSEYVMRIKKSGDIKIEVSSKEYTIQTAYIGDNVKIMRKERVHSDLCAEGTRKEFDKANSKNMPNMEFKDLKVEKLSGTATIVGYECKSAKITYKTTGFIPMSMENIVWYTDQFKPEASNFTGTVPDGKKNAYNDAVASLGFVLKTESKGFAGVSVISEITEIKKQDFTSSDMDIYMADCKKILDFDDYNKKVSQREFQKQQSDQNFQKQMRQNHK